MFLAGIYGILKVDSLSADQVESLRVGILLLVL